MIREHLNPQSFEEAIYGDMVVLEDDSKRAWLAWESEDGEWYASRPRDEEDAPGPEDDRWRPIGPMGLCEVPFPVRAVRLADVSPLLQRVADLEVELAAERKRSSDLSWAVNPDRMGQ